MMLSLVINYYNEKLKQLAICCKYATYHQHDIIIASHSQTFASYCSSYNINEILHLDIVHNFIISIVLLLLSFVLLYINHYD